MSLETAMNTATVIALLSDEVMKMYQAAEDIHQFDGEAGLYVETICRRVRIEVDRRINIEMLTSTNSC